MILTEVDNDGFNESFASYHSGIIQNFSYDRNQDRTFDIKINFSPNGVPVSGVVFLVGQETLAEVSWERYPSVSQITLGTPANETFIFRPADFQFAPVELIALGGSRNLAGLTYPVPLHRNLNLTRRALVLASSSIRRPSVEFDGGVEEIFLERGIPWKAVETLNERQVSVTEFERGLPVVQRIDLDLDGRMETTRRFRRPTNDDFFETFDYRALIEFSQSDWRGDGAFMTSEMYLPDGSVVSSFDMDGSGEMNFSETSAGRER
jgi:hypothetical protein